MPVQHMILTPLCTVMVASLALSACSSSDSSDSSAGAGGTHAAVGGGAATGGSVSTGVGGSTSSGTDAQAVVGSITVTLNPAIDVTGAYTSIAGKIYTGPQLSDVESTPVVQNATCTVYKYEVRSCTSPACTTSQSCVQTNVCKENPTLVSIGEATISGIGGSTIKLSAINKNYQYAGDITYPGFAEGDSLKLTAAGDAYPGFTISTPGVAPITLSSNSYTIGNGSPLEVKWTAGSSSINSQVKVGLNISKHGGSVGYLECATGDTGSLTIPAEYITALIGLGVSGYPQLTVTRSTRNVAAVSSGVVEFVVSALANPNLQVQGYCSCTENSDCGSCGDTTKTTCNTVKKLCYAP